MRKTVFRRRYVSVCLFFFICFGISFQTVAQESEKIRVAVKDFEMSGQKFDIPELDKLVTEWLTLFLVQTETIEVVERQNLEKVLQEQALGQSGVVNEESAARIGEILGVKVIITGTLIGFEDTLEITARLIDSTNGVLLGIENIVVADEEELRSQVKKLAGRITRTLGGEPGKKDGAKLIETFDGEIFDTDQWLLEFDEDASERDQNNTDLTQENGVLTITGRYPKKFDEHRSAWMLPDSEIAYQAIEVKVRVSEVTGEISACLGADWNDGERWIGYCLYFEKNYGAISVFIEEDEETEETLVEGLKLEQWYSMRLEYTNDQFLYYWDGHLVKSITPKEQVSLEPYGLAFVLSLENTQTMIVEVDEIIFY